MNIAKHFNSGRRLLIVASTALALTQTLPAMAASVATGDIPDIAVRYPASALDTAQGATDLLHRIEAAAGKVCGSIYGESLHAHVAWARCKTRLTDDAVAEVGSPMLLTVYESSTGKVRSRSYAALVK